MSCGRFLSIAFWMRLPMHLQHLQVDKEQSNSGSQVHVVMQMLEVYNEKPKPQTHHTGLN